jgi:hypothetical protein
MAERFDVGDKLACSLGFKKNIGNYSSLDFHVSVSISKREGETDDEFTERGWAEAQQQLEWQVAKEAAILEVVRPVTGSQDEWS